MYGAAGLTNTMWTDNIGIKYCDHVTADNTRPSLIRNPYGGCCRMSACVISQLSAAPLAASPAVNVVAASSLINNW